MESNQRNDPSSGHGEIRERAPLPLGGSLRWWFRPVCRFCAQIPDLRFQDASRREIEAHPRASLVAVSSLGWSLV